MDNINTAPEKTQRLPKLLTTVTPFSKILAMILFIIFPIIGFWLGYKYNQSVNVRTASIETIQQKNPNITLTPTLEPTPTPIVRNNWEYVINKICNVQIPIPPTKEPYIVLNDNNPSGIYNDVGRVWQYEEYDSGWFSEIESTISTARAIFIGPLEGGSGFVPGDVEIACGKNTHNYTTESLFNKLSLNLQSGGVTAKIKQTDTMWGHNVLAVELQNSADEKGEVHYLFATSKNIYWVSKIAGSENKSVKNATEEIFTKLKFL